MTSFGKNGTYDGGGWDDQVLTFGVGEHGSIESFRRAFE
ncbi:hypothetical protein STSP2_00959 [Anaerohalosphaera lusitana]|uniref:Uncharacterized protein n=1 Tax=Anaerohalosphaera lusitana TaxID=1936003 RepID=A0A1U9NIQ3_9BACT|nr:hypothetical protein STSP2_00959 [Anaerohalosphaera lusitana]